MIYYDMSGGRGFRSQLGVSLDCFQVIVGGRPTGGFASALSDAQSSTPSPFGKRVNLSQVQSSQIINGAWICGA